MTYFGTSPDRKIIYNADGSVKTLIWDTYTPTTTFYGYVGFGFDSGVTVSNTGFVVSEGSQATSYQPYIKSNLQLTNGLGGLTYTVVSTF